MEVGTFSENDARLCIPLVDSAFHRLIVHSVCQFYGVRSRSTLTLHFRLDYEYFDLTLTSISSIAEANRRYNTKLMVLKSPKTKFTQEQLEKVSLCEFVRETRLRRPIAPPTARDGGNQGQEDPLEELTKTSECSDGYCLMDYPSV
jgi:hypothetical protein